MVQEIIKNINLKTSRQLEVIERQKEIEISRAKQAYEERLKIEREKKKKAFRQEILSEIESFRQSKESAFKFQVQAEKNRALEEVYKKAKEIINGMPEGEFLKLIKAILASAPEEKKTILAGPKTAQILKNLIKAKEIKGNLEEEGFIVKNDQVDYDFTISQWLKSLKEKNDPEVAKILF